MGIGQKIGEGANAEVFEWENDQKVIKLAKPNIDKSYLQKEYTNSLTMWKMGLPVPQVYEMVEVNNRPGIIFERIYGKTLRERFFESLVPQKNVGSNDVRLSASLLVKIHNLSHKELPNKQREFLKKQIRSANYLREDEKEAVVEILDSLPQKNKICHGDANPNNILITDDGEPMLIDWMNAANGNPEADIAEFIIMIRFAILPPSTPQEAVRLFDSTREKIIQEFMDEYTPLTGITYDEVDPWIVPLAARKLSSDGIVEEEKELLVNEIRRRLEKE